jgi:hypothetical protein
MKELLGIAHVRDDEEEVPNVKHMHVVEEEVSLSQPITIAVLPGLRRFLLQEEFPSGPPIAVPLEEEEVPVPHGTSVVVSLEEEVPLEEEEVLAAPLVAVPPEGRGCLVLVPALVCFSPFFSFSKMQGILLALFSHKCGRFVGLEPDFC